MVETFAFVLFREAFPVELRSLQEAQGAHHIRLREGERILDRAVHVAFCSKVDNTIDFFILHKLVECIEIANIHLHELVVRLTFDILKIRKVPCVRELVEVDNFVFGILVHEKAHYMTSDKACTTGDYDILHNSSLSFEAGATLP